MNAMAAMNAMKPMKVMKATAAMKPMKPMKVMKATAAMKPMQLMKAMKATKSMPAMKPMKAMTAMRQYKKENRRGYNINAFPLFMFVDIRGTFGQVAEIKARPLGIYKGEVALLGK